MFEQFEQLSQRLRKTAISDINFFKMLGIHHNEVLICRLIGFLLMPHTPYAIGTEPLKLFLSIISPNTYSEHALQQAHIVLEESIENDRRVDIVLYIADDVFPIEVKINAEDQCSQLFDYYHHFKRQNDRFSTIFYLTPNRRPPSAASITSKEGDRQLDIHQDVCCLSFEQLLTNWLDQIHTENPTYMLLIEQFKEVIRYMTCSEYNRHEIYKELSLTDADSFCINGAVETVLKLMALDQQELWHCIRDRYLRKCLDYEKDRYELVEDNGDDIRDRFCLYAVIHKESRKKAAWICVETNLYVVCKHKAVLGMKGSDSYFWQYLNPNHKAEAFPLKAVNTDISDDDTIDIRSYLAVPAADDASLLV